MPDSLDNIGIYLINTLFDLYLVVLGARLILAWVRANYFNPVTRFIIKITQPIVSPVRRIIPTYWGIEFATLFLMIVFELLKMILISSILLGGVDLSVIFILAVLGCIKMVLTVIFYSILIGAIMSLLSPGHTPVSEVLYQISSPVLKPLRRLIPPIGGIDITPIPALIILQVLIRLT